MFHEFVSRRKERIKRDEEAVEVAEMIAENVRTTGEQTDEQLRVSCMGQHNRFGGIFDSPTYSKLKKVDRLSMELVGEGKLDHDERWLVYEAVFNQGKEPDIGMAYKLISRTMTREEYHLIRRNTPKQLVDLWKTNETREAVLAL